MADKIERLGDFMEAIRNEFEYAIVFHQEHTQNQFHDFIGCKMTQLLSDNINEQDYIEKWNGTEQAD